MYIIKFRRKHYDEIYIYMLKITFPSVIVINGGQQQGKSSLIRYIFGQNKDKLKYGIIFSNTAFSSENNYDYIPEKYVHYNFNEDKLKKLMEIRSRTPKEK